MAISWLLISVQFVIYVLIIAVVLNNWLKKCKIHMGVLRQMAEYLYLKKKDPNRPHSKWIGYMHGINRLSMLLFLFALIVIAIKLLRR